MSASAGDSTRPRRWPAILALAIILPVALAAHGWETAREWWYASDLFEIRVNKDSAATSYAGADWRLAGLHRIETRKNGAAIVVVELEAKVTDAAAFATGPCELALENSDTRWLPVFLGVDEVRDVRPELADLSSCNVVRSKGPALGEPVRIAETFEIPAKVVDGVTLSLAVPGGRPDYLVFQP